MQRPRHPCPTGAAAQEQGRFQGQCPEKGEPRWSCIPILHSTKRTPTSTAASSASSARPLLKEGAGTDILHQLQDPKCLATAVPCGRCSRAPSTALGSAVTGTASLGTLPRGQGAEKRLQEVPEHSRRCQLLALLPSTCLAKPQAGAGLRNLAAREQQRGWGAGRVLKPLGHQHRTFSVLVSHGDVLKIRFVGAGARGGCAAGTGSPGGGDGDRDRGDSGRWHRQIRWKLPQPCREERS